MKKLTLLILGFGSALGVIDLLLLACGAGTVQAGIGHVDRGFGDEGALMLSSKLEEGSDTALLPDGRVVVAGYKGLLVLLPSGQVDDGFGAAGFAPFVPPPGETSVSISSVLVDSQGRLVVVGHSGSPSKSEDGHEGFRSQLLIERFTADGQLDRSFGTDGFTATGLDLPPPGADKPPSVWTRSAVLDGRDRIVLSGTRSSGSYFYKGFYLGRTEAFFARFTADGAVDGSFASGGVLRLPGVEGAGAPVADERGGVYFGAGEAIVHLRDDGQADPEFGENGGRPMPKGTGSNPVLDPSGRLLVYGYLQGWKEHRLANGVLIKRLLPDGSPDRSFGHSGSVAFRLPRLYTARVNVDEKGGVLIAAALKRRQQKGRHPALPAGFALVRLRPGGSLDAGFGRRGIVSIPFRSQGVNVEDLDVVGNEALLGGIWCGGGCGRALARVDLGSG